MQNTEPADHSGVGGIGGHAGLALENARLLGLLRDKELELERANRMKSEFLATMSHELRTPLNAIIGFSEALKEGLMGDLSEQQRGFVGDIFDSGLQLLSLINDILDLSSVEAGAMTLDVAAVDARALLLSNVTIVQGKARALGIRLELDAPDTLGVLPLDSRKTKQIVHNLLTNALKFSASGTQVVLRARRVARDAVGLFAQSWPVQTFAACDAGCEEFLEISVTDSGIGIAEADMARLFANFSQIDSGLARRFQGTGLGLALVRQLVELHGGAVAVASAEGEGACFAVWLPLRTPSYADLATQLASEQAVR